MERSRYVRRRKAHCSLPVNSDDRRFPRGLSSNVRTDPDSPMSGHVRICRMVDVCAPEAASPKSDAVTRAPDLSRIQGTAPRADLRRDQSIQETIPLTSVCQIRCQNAHRAGITINHTKIRHRSSLQINPHDPNHSINSSRQPDS